MRTITVPELRRYAIARSLFKPTTLAAALRKLGFVQADPIRAPARAQDLTLRHRVIGYCAGDLERRYPRLRLEEGYFVNYGFMSRRHHHLMHPRKPRTAWSAARRRQAELLLEFIRARGSAHPRVVDAHFAQGKVTNWFGGSSNASTQLLDEMHHRGLLRVARREAGTRVYAVREAGREAPATHAAPDVEARIDTLVDLFVQKYAPLPASTLSQLSSHLCRGTPQWVPHRAAALERAKRRLASARLDGIDWYWPAGQTPHSARWRTDEAVRLLTPFDPVVWDRCRFELFWKWPYRFEAYTPAAKRKLGYYALPLLWREQIIGWGNLALDGGRLSASFGYIDGHPPREASYTHELEAEVARMRAFLKTEPSG